MFELADQTIECSVSEAFPDCRYEDQIEDKLLLRPDSNNITLLDKM